MQPLIPHSKPAITEADIAQAAATIRSGRLAAGESTRELEEVLTRRLGRPSVCVSSGTAGLHMALLSAGAVPGDRIAVPTHCCPSVLYAVNYIGAEAVLYDCGSLGIGISDSAYDRLRDDDRLKIIIVVHQYGFPVSGITGLPGDRVIEDCAAALGALVDCRPVGTFGRAAVFSFYGTKLLAGGECGAVAAEDEVVKWIRGHRTPRGADTVETCYPYSPAEVCSALALSQFNRLDEFINRRRTLAEIYRSELGNCVEFTKVDPQCQPVWHRCIIGLNMDRETLIHAAGLEGIHLGYGVRTPLHRLVRKAPRDFPFSEHAWRSTVSLPIYPDLTELEQERIIECIKRRVPG